MKILKKSLKVIPIILILAIIGYNVLWVINYQNVKHISKTKGLTYNENLREYTAIKNDNYKFDISLPPYLDFSWWYHAYYYDPDRIYNLIALDCNPSNSFFKSKDKEFCIYIVFNPTEDNNSVYQEYPSYTYIVNSDLDILEIIYEQEKGQGEKIFEDTFDELVKLKDEAIKIYGEEYYR